MKIKRLSGNDASVELGFDYPDIATVHESELAALEEQESELRKTLARREEQLRDMIKGINTCYEILHVCLENNMSPTTSYRNEISNYRDRAHQIIDELEKNNVGMPRKHD